MKNEILTRFLRYVTVDTQSDENSATLPSTKKQFNLAEILKNELVAMGAENVVLTEHCYVYAEIPATSGCKTKLGFISHVDTSPDAPGDLKTPTVVEHYDGKDIVLSKETVLSPEVFPSLKDYVGKTLVLGDGRTLLGADDKAGVAIIMQTAEYLLKHKEIAHGKISIAFTPDEEVGRGVEGFEQKIFDCDFAYTVDGGPLGELNCENFNAAAAKIDINGKSIHPGSAKGQMINASAVAIELDNLLPDDERPQFTEGYQGFFHMTKINCTTEKGHVDYIIRDHDLKLFEKRKEIMRSAVETLNKKYGANTVVLNLTDTYFNMREVIKKNKHLVDNAVAAFAAENVKAEIVPIRGGTDGATLSNKGLPCPNLSGCYCNCHGRYEYAVLDDMATMVKVCLHLVDAYNKY